MMKMLKTGEIICPICGNEIMESDHIDIEVDITTVTLFKVGKCDYCGNHYRWCDEYTLAGYRDLEQVNYKDEYEPDVDECGFDPYEGCYTYDC